MKLMIVRNRIIRVAILKEILLIFSISLQTDLKNLNQFIGYWDIPVKSDLLRTTLPVADKVLTSSQLIFS